MSASRIPTNYSDLESQISRALIHFEKEFMGRGPLETRTYVLGDLVLVRLKGVLTPAERKLCETQSDRSAYLLKQVRNELLVSGRPLLEAVIRDIVGVEILSIHTDICTKTGERVFVFSLEQRPQTDGEKADSPNGSQREASNAADEDNLVSLAAAKETPASRNGRGRST